MNRCLEKLSPWIVNGHGKNLTWEFVMQVHFPEVVLGAGKFDHSTYLKRLAVLSLNPPLMIEAVKTKQEYHRDRDF